jgi:hypothetical protein
LVARQLDAVDRPAQRGRQRDDQERGEQRRADESHGSQYLINVDGSALALGSSLEEPSMSRGWESKSVESQQATDVRADRGEALTPEQRELRQKREGLELSRRRVLQEIETARSDVRRASLEQALAFLEAEIGKLDL